MLADQTVCLGCGTTNHGTKFCPECGAPAVPAPSEEPTLTQPVSGAASNATADDQPGDDTNPGAERAAQPLRRVSAIAPTTATTGLSNRRLTVWVGVACLLALVGIAVGVVGMLQALHANSDNHSLRAQLTTVRHHVVGDEARVGQVAQQMTTIPGRATMAAVQAKITAAQTELSGVSRTVHGIQSQDAKYTNCIPELQTELSGLNINWSIDAVDVSQSSFFIQNSSQVSHDCSKLLYGS